MPEVHKEPTDEEPTDAIVRTMALLSWPLATNCHKCCNPRCCVGAATSNGHYVAVGTTEGTVLVYDMRTFPPVLIRRMRAIALDPPAVPSPPEVLVPRAVEEEVAESLHAGILANWLSTNNKPKEATAAGTTVYKAADADQTKRAEAPGKPPLAQSLTDGTAAAGEGEQEVELSAPQVELETALASWSMPESQVAGLAWDSAASQLTAVVGRFTVHAWSMAQNGYAAPSQPPHPPPNDPHLFATTPHLRQLLARMPTCPPLVEKFESRGLTSAARVGVRTANRTITNR